MPNNNTIRLQEVEEICIIDDDYVPRFLAQKIFGYEMPDVPVVDFDGAIAALQHLNTAPVKKRLILLDLNMPIHDGWHFVEHYPSVPHQNLLFILSSSDNPKDRLKLKDYPHVTDFLEKPITINQLSDLRAKY